MSIDWFRDLAIVVLALVSVVALIFVCVLTFLLYRRARSVLDTTQGIVSTVHKLSHYIGEEVAKPMVQMAAIVQGVRQGIEAVTKCCQKKEGGQDEQSG